MTIIHRKNPASHRIMARAFGISALAWLLFVGAGCDESKPSGPVSKPVERSHASEIPDPDRSSMDPAVARAIATARQQVMSNPQSGNAWAQYAEMLDAHALVDESVIAYERANTLRPNQFTILYNLAYVLDHSGKEGDRVVECYQQATQLADSYVAAHYRLGIALASRQRFDDAKASLDRALALSPDDPAVHLAMGQAMLSAGRVDDAVEHLRSARAAAPPDRALLAALSQALTRAGDRDGAQEAMTAAADAADHAIRIEDALRAKIAAKSMTSSSCFNRAVRLLEAQDPAGAMQHLRLAEEAMPENAAIQFRIGAALEMMGQFDQAVASVRKAIELEPDAMDARMKLAQMLAGAGDYAGAALAYRDAVARAPDNAALHALLARELARSGKPDEAVATFEQAAKLGPLDADAYINWGTSLARMRRFADAEPHFREAVALDPNNADAHFNLGLTLETTGNQTEAIGHYRTAVRIDPNHRAAMRLAQVERQSR